MSKPTVIPSEFPVNADGKIVWVKKSQYAKTVADALTITLKAQVSKAHLDEMLKNIEERGAKELNAEAPPEMHKAFERVWKDWDAAVEHVADLKREEDEAKAKKEREEKELAEKEDQLVSVAAESTVDFATLGKTFDTGENMDRFIPRKDVSDEVLINALTAGFRMGEFNNWMIGDLVVELENRNQLGVVSKLAEKMGKNYTNVYNAAKTARNVPPEKRTKGVSYTIFAEIANAKLDADETKHKEKMLELVDKAAKGEIKNSQEARELKNKAAGKTAPTIVLEEDSAKAEFIVIDHKQELAQITVGFPKELFDNGAMVISKKTGKMFQSFRAKPENRWADLPIYKKPATPVTATTTPAAKKKGKK